MEFAPFARVISIHFLIILSIILASLIYSFFDIGVRKRAIVSMRKQDVNITGIRPIDERLTIMGASSPAKTLHLPVISFNRLLPTLIP